MTSLGRVGRASRRLSSSVVNQQLHTPSERLSTTPIEGTSRAPFTASNQGRWIHQSKTLSPSLTVCSLSLPGPISAVALLTSSSPQTPSLFHYVRAKAAAASLQSAIDSPKEKGAEASPRPCSCKPGPSTRSR